MARWREGCFYRTDALCASAKTGPTQTEASHGHGKANERQVAQWRHASVKPGLSLRACRARPSETWSSQGNGPCGGRVGIDAKGGFFGGTRSARPDCEAVLMPRHNMVMKGQWNARWPNGDMPRSSQGLPFGRAEPAPPRRGQAKVMGLAGERPGMTRRAVFAEGCALCVRVARLYACRGISLPARGWARDQWPKGDGVWMQPWPVFGRAEPPSETLRPHWRVVRMPKHFLADPGIGSLGGLGCLARWSNGMTCRLNLGPDCGRAELALRNVCPPKLDGLSG